MKKFVLLGIGSILVVVGAAVALNKARQQNITITNAKKDITMHVLPPLPYAYNALEPYIEQEIMELHHKKHQQAYVDGLNAALEKHPALFARPIVALLKDLDAVPADIRTAVQNHGGGVENHTFFWNCMQANTSNTLPEPTGALAAAIAKEFGSFANFKEQFNNAAKTRFGSGWAWLVVDQDTAKLSVVSTANQDTPLSQGLVPLLGLDVWEHAYYLQYKNRRMDYTTAWWYVVNWHFVQMNYHHALNK